MNTNVTIRFLMLLSWWVIPCMQLQHSSLSVTIISVQKLFIPAEGHAIPVGCHEFPRQCVSICLDLMKKAHSHKVMMEAVTRSKQSNYFKLQANKTFPFFVFLRAILDFQSWKTGTGKRTVKLVKEELQLVSKTSLSSIGSAWIPLLRLWWGIRYPSIHFKQDLPPSSPAKSKASPGE